MRKAWATEWESRLCSLGRTLRRPPQPTPSPGGNLTLRAGVGRKTELLSPRLGKPQVSILPDAPPALRRLGDEWATGAELWVAGTGDHISISSREAPRSPEQEGAGMEKPLRAPEPHRVSTAA